MRREAPRRGGPVVRVGQRQRRRDHFADVGAGEQCFLGRWPALRWLHGQAAAGEIQAGVLEVNVGRRIWNLVRADRVRAPVAEWDAHVPFCNGSASKISYTLPAQIAFSP